VEVINRPFAPRSTASFNIFEQQYQASFFDEADRETEGAAMPQIGLYLLQKSGLSVVCQKLIRHDASDLLQVYQCRTTCTGMLL
jgi:hypothetical protein